jgi:hypothetical protein
MEKSKGKDKQGKTMNKWAYKNAKSGNLNKNWISLINNTIVLFRRIFKGY